MKDNMTESRKKNKHEMAELIDNYTIEELKTIRDLRELFPNVEATKDRWLLLSTEGYHGTKITLDDLEAILREEHEITSSINGRYWITVLVVYPKKVSAQTGLARMIPLLKYGEIMVDIDDIPWLREIVRATLDNIKESQYGNY